MYCRYKEPFRFYCINEENAQEILKLLGFGEEICKKTYEEDGRFGTVEYYYIRFGFENKMVTRYFFGNYIVFDNNYPHRYMTEKEFFEEYEIIKKR